MYAKMRKIKIHSILMGILVLSLILPYPSSLCADLCNGQDISASLRAAASANGNILPPEIFKAAPPVDQEFLATKPGATDKVVGTEGVVAYIDSDGRVTLIGAGTKLDLTISRVPQRLTPQEISEIKKSNSEFSGEPIDTVGGGFRLLHMLDQELIDAFLRGAVLEKDGYIKFDVEFLPDFPLDDNKGKLVEAALNTLAMRLLQYKILFHDKIHIEFVSTAGNSNKIERVKDIFSKLDIVNKRLDKIIGAAPQGTDASHILLITHKAADIKRLKDTEKLEYTILYLEQTLMIDEKTMGAYPLHAVMDLAVSVLIIKNLKVEEQKEFLLSIKNIFERLIGREIDDDTLKAFLGPNVADSEKAALALVLPPIEKLNLEESIGRVIDIMAEVAKYA